MGESSLTLRQRVRRLVDVPPEGGRHLDWFDLSIGVLIVLNVVALILESVQLIHDRHDRALQAFEYFSVAVFSIEYLLRLWSCTADPKYRHPILGRIRFALRPMLLIDLLAILPAFLPILGIDLRFLRVLRLMRITRVLKLGRYSEATGLLMDVLKRKRAELGAMLFVLAILLILASSLMFEAEHDAQPDKFSSIPASMWWAVITLTTIGYGDVYPITILGKILGGLIAVSGIGIVALPTAIIATGFADELKARAELKKSKQLPTHQCPHCGKEIGEVKH